MGYKIIDMLIGFGEGGKRLSHDISQELHDYNGSMEVIALNFSKDAGHLSITDELIKDTGGTGRQAARATEYYQQNREEIRGRLLWGNLNKYVPKNIWVVACLGGGVGTGSIQLGLDDIFEWRYAYQKLNPDYDPLVYLILTLPKASEGATLKRTAFRYLNNLITNYIKTDRLSGTLLIDNSTAEALYGIAPDSIWGNINKGVIKAIKDIYRFPVRQDVNWSAGYKKFDLNDLKTVLTYGSGFIDFRKSIITKDVLLNYLSEGKWYDKDLKTHSLLCSSHDINTTKRYAAIIGVPDSWMDDVEIKDCIIPFVDILFNAVRKKAKCNDYIFANYTSKDLTSIEINIICSGMPLSQKINKLITSIVRDLMKDKNKKEVTEIDLTAFEDLGI